MVQASYSPPVVIDMAQAGKYTSLNGSLNLLHLTHPYHNTLALDQEKKTSRIICYPSLAWARNRAFKMLRSMWYLVLCDS